MSGEMSGIGALVGLMILVGLATCVVWFVWNGLQGGGNGAIKDEEEGMAEAIGRGVYLGLIIWVLIRLSEVRWS